MKGNPRSFYGQIQMGDLDPLFMTNKNLGIRKAPQTVVETPFDKLRWTPREFPISSSSSSKNQREETSQVLSIISKKRLQT